MKRIAVVASLTLLLLALLTGAAAASKQMTGAGWANSNRSGEVTVSGGAGPTPLLREVPGQLTHTDFKINTNSCASCHMTHTAAGPNLLIRATTSDTCFACHNGTMGFLNVNATPSGTAHNAGMGGSVAAGTFAPTTGRTPSVHSLSPVLKISAAPGGRRDGQSERGAWTQDFSCASCHAPHGSHSIRLLHFNPNNVAVRATVDAAVYGVQGGRYMVSGATNLRVDQAVYNAAYQVWEYPATGIAAPWVAGYTHGHTVSGVGRVSQFWTRIYHLNWNPNTVATGVYADPTVDIGSGNADNLLTRHFIINYATGRIMQTDAQRNALIARLQLAPFNLSAAAAAAAELRIDVASALQVRGRAAAGYQGNLVLGARQVDFIDPTSYDAPAYNLFCAACHTDYLPTVAAADQSAVHTGGVGLYERKFRHTINRRASTANSRMPVRGWTEFSGSILTGSGSGTDNQLMCLSCHFAHGVSADMMLLANNTRVSANTGLAGTPTDPNQNDVSGAMGGGLNGSSALKRYINQASCWHCHVRSAATPFMNTAYYWTEFPTGPTW